MQTTKEQWQEWRQSEVTKEWFELIKWRISQYEQRTPPYIKDHDKGWQEEVLVLAGRHQELMELLQTDYEDMK